MAQNIMTKFVNISKKPYSVPCPDELIVPDWGFVV